MNLDIVVFAAALVLSALTILIISRVDNGRAPFYHRMLGLLAGLGIVVASNPALHIEAPWPAFVLGWVAGFMASFVLIRAPKPERPAPATLKPVRIRYQDFEQAARIATMIRQITDNPHHPIEPDPQDPKHLLLTWLTRRQKAALAERLRVECIPVVHEDAL
ncbi:MAG: hypothetical protein P8Y64_01120 [Gammaproteobacteria bacterium]